jgi:hypothetical protein
MSPRARLVLSVSHRSCSQERQFPVCFSTNDAMWTQRVEVVIVYIGTVPALDSKRAAVYASWTTRPTFELTTYRWSPEGRGVRRRTLGGSSRPRAAASLAEIQLAEGCQGAMRSWEFDLGPCHNRRHGAGCRSIKLGRSCQDMAADRADNC